MIINSPEDFMSLKLINGRYNIFEDYRLSCFEEGYESAIKHLWLNNIEGIEPTHIIRLKRALGNVWNIYDASERILADIVSEQVGRRIARSKSGSRIIELYHRIEEKGIMLLYPEKSSYPHKLRHIYTPPQLLYVKGRLKNCLNEYNKTVGMVGSRNPSVYGREICRCFGESLARAGYSIVSGLARGIDGIAHKAALDNGGYTVAVLGSGINVAYPRSNIDLYARIEENGAVISEYGLDAKPNPWQFPIRNRIISGLSDGILVVEARAESGSLITAEHALEQGRTVYSVPGRIMDKNSEGNNSILREGAICVTKPEDIIEDLNGVTYVSSSIENKNNTKYKDIENIDVTPEEQKILSVLSLDPIYIDEIIQKTHLGVTKTISMLYVLEEKRLIKQQSKGYYILYI